MIVPLLTRVLAHRAILDLFRITLLLATVWVSGLQAGCTASQANPPTPSPITTETPRTALPTAAYRIQFGDLLDIRFFNNPEFSQEARVRPDGRITLPYIDDVAVAELTPSEVDALVTERFRRVLLRPEITIIVREFAGQRVYVGGEVTRPGLITLTGRTTALQAILSAGGFLDTARMSQVLLIRKGGNERHTGYALDLTQGLRVGGVGNDVMLQPADVVFVPKTRIAKVNQFVDQYIRRLLPLPGSFGIGLP